MKGYEIPSIYLVLVPPLTQTSVVAYTQMHGLMCGGNPLHRHLKLLYLSSLIRYVPPPVWGTSGHMQTVVYSLMTTRLGFQGNQLTSERKRVKLSDGTVITFDIFQRVGADEWAETGEEPTS